MNARVFGAVSCKPDQDMKQASDGRLLKLISNSSAQEVAGEPHRRRHAMKPPPLAAQLEDGHSESRTSAFATSIARFSTSPTAPRFDAVAANAIIGLR